MISFPSDFFEALRAAGYRATADVADGVCKRLPGVTLRWSIDVFGRITLRGTAQDVEVSLAWTDNGRVVDMEARALRMLQVEPAAVQPTEAETAKVRLHELQALEAATEALLATYMSESAGLRRKWAIGRVRLTGLCRYPEVGAGRNPPTCLFEDRPNPREVTRAEWEGARG